jgi:hypothetical protein
VAVPVFGAPIYKAWAGGPKRIGSRNCGAVAQDAISSKIITDLFLSACIVVAVLCMYFDGNPPERDPPRRRLQPRP